MNSLFEGVVRDIDQAKEARTPAVLHRNGSIQLDLPSDRRLQIWVPGIELIQPDPELPIHDHISSFSKSILAGKLVNIMYRVEHAGTFEPVEDIEYIDYHIYEIYPYGLSGTQKRFGVEDDGRPVNITAEAAITYLPGDGYEFEAHSFHATKAEGFTAAVIQYKERNRRRWPRVLCPVDQIPDGNFNRNQKSQVELWEIIGELTSHLSDPPEVEPHEPHPLTEK